MEDWKLFEELLEYSDKYIYLSELRITTTNKQTATKKYVAFNFASECYYNLNHIIRNVECIFAKKMKLLPPQEKCFHQ